MKLDWKPGTLLYPLPAVLVSCAHNGRDNLLTVAWTGTVCTDPPMLYISVRPGRFSYSLIAESGEFTVNLTTAAGHAVGCPAVEESPLSLECKVEKVLELGTHHMFLARVANVQADSAYMDPDGRFDLARAGLLNYSHGHYYCQGRPLGHFGFSVRKPGTKHRK